MRKVSPRVMIYAAGAAAPSLDEGWIALPQRPSAAFGDGTHPTTQLCAGALDLLCRTGGIESCLDVGTGTGILARIARARGVGFVAGTDICAEALADARVQVELDATETVVHLSDAAPDHWGPRFALIVANILEAPLRQLSAPLARALRPGGTLLISGFTAAQTPALLATFSSQGLASVRESALGEWRLLMFQRPAKTHDFSAYGEENTP